MCPISPQITSITTVILYPFTLSSCVHLPLLISISPSQLSYLPWTSKYLKDPHSSLFSLFPHVLLPFIDIKSHLSELTPALHPLSLLSPHPHDPLCFITISIPYAPNIQYPQHLCPQLICICCFLNPWHPHCPLIPLRLLTSSWTLYLSTLCTSTLCLCSPILCSLYYPAITPTVLLPLTLQLSSHSSHPKEEMLTTLFQRSHCKHCPMGCCRIGKNKKCAKASALNHLEV